MGADLENRETPRRILLAGSSGSGKSTLAAALGSRLGLPVVHLDREHWQPGWIEPAREEWDAQVERLCASPAWIMDGEYPRTLSVRLAACDTVVFLDLSRWLCLFRVIWRSLYYRGKARPDLHPGCPEPFPPEWKFLLWILSYLRKHSRPVLAALAALSGEKRVVHLRSPSEVRRFLGAVALGNSK